MMDYGKQQSDRMNNAIFEVFYQSLFIGMTLFYYNWFCSFLATSLYDSMFLFLARSLFELPNLIVYGVFHNSTINEINDRYPALYIDGMIRKQLRFEFYLIQYFL